MGSSEEVEKDEDGLEVGGQFTLVEQHSQRGDQRKETRCPGSECPGPGAEAGKTDSEGL